MKKNNKGWSPHSIGEEFRKGIYTEDEIKGSQGRLSSPLCSLQLKNRIDFNGAGSATFNRATTATYIDRYGVLQYASVDEPRFEKDGLLIEGDSTNNILYSDDISNPAYTQVGVTIGTPQLSPDQTTYYQEIVEDNNNNRHTNYQLDYNTDPQSENITISRIVKRGVGSRNVVLYCAGGGFQGPDRFGKAFDLGIGVAMTGGVDEVGSGVLTGYNITELTDGYFLISVSGSIAGTPSSAVVNCLAIVENTQTSGNIGLTRVGDGASSIISGAVQTEQLPFATSYIPTTTTAVTRSKDVLTAPYYNNFPGWDKPFSISFSYTPVNFNNGVNNIVFSTGSLTSYINFSAGGYLSYRVNRGNIAVVSSTIVQDSSHVACTSDGVTTKLYVDGVLKDSGTVGSDAATTTGIYIGHDSINSQQVNTSIKNFKIYDYELSATDVALLSGGN